MSLLSKNLEQLKAASGYKFSATKVDALGAAEYTLATVVLDVSGSVASYRQQLEQMVKTIFIAMKKSPRADNLMFRVVLFDDYIKEFHGFKLLSGIQESDYNGCINIGGSTALFEAMDEAIQATTAYGKQLTSQDFTVNGITVVVTDGGNNAGTIMDPKIVKTSKENAQKTEALESNLTILVGVTNDDTNLDHYLQNVKDNAGIDSYISIGTATPGKIAKLAQFISQSISSQSSSLGTGKPSQPLNPSNFNF